MPLAFPVSGRAHVHAPSIPHLHQLKTLFQKFVHEARFLELAHEALHGFLEYGLDVIAVIGRDIAVEVIVAGRAGTAAARMALFHDDDVLASGLARRDARHEAADAAADDEEIRFDYRLDGDHDLTSLVVRVDASTMPAFFGELDAGKFVDAAVKDEKVRIADFGTSAASGTLLPVDQRRHRKTPLWNVLHISQYDNCSLRMIRF